MAKKGTREKNLIVRSQFVAVVEQVLVNGTSLPDEIYSNHALRVDECTDRLLKWQHDDSLQPESAIRHM